MPLSIIYIYIYVRIYLSVDRLVAKYIAGSTLLTSSSSVNFIFLVGLGSRAPGGLDFIPKNGARTLTKKKSLLSGNPLSKCTIQHGDFEVPAVHTGSQLHGEPSHGLRPDFLVWSNRNG